MFCWKCGAQLAEGSDFCASCGARQTAPGSSVQQDKPQKPVKLIALFVAVFAVSILATVLVVSMGENKGSASAAPGVSSSAPQSVAKPEAPASAVTPAPAAGEPEEDRERETSGAWKRALYEWVEEQHGHNINGNNDEINTIRLFRYGGDNTIGFTYTSKANDELAQANAALALSFTIVYAPEDDHYVPATPTGADICTFFRNDETGVIDLFAAEEEGESTEIYVVKDGVWVKRLTTVHGVGALLCADDGTETEISLRDGESKMDDLLKGHSEVTDLPEFSVTMVQRPIGRANPSWADIAGDFSDFLNDFDGIEITLGNG